MPDVPKPSTDGVAHAVRRFASTELIVVLLVLLVSGAVNFVLLKCLYSAYGEAQAFFVSQGINVVYCVYGGLCVYPRMLPCGVGDGVSAAVGLEPITPAMRKPAHQRRFLAMGALDCLGTFLTAMGAVFTPGQFQPLLNQSLIPATMLASFFFLGTRYSRGQLFAALLLVGGAALSVLPKLLPGTDRGAQTNDETRLYAVALYWLSNVPMACSAVYKEARFSREPMEVTYLTQSVSIYQMLLGFALAPLQVLPGIGSANGQSWSAILSSFRDGLDCFLGAEPSSLSNDREGCAWDARHSASPAVLLLAYVLVNFVFNTMGLYLTKHGGAVLNSISYSLLLPLTTILFSLPILGPYRETAMPSTFAGLVVVMAGFALWRYCQLHHESQITAAVSDVVDGVVAEPEPPATRPLPPLEVPLLSAPRPTPLSIPPELLDPVPVAASPPMSFQERLVGVGRITTAGSPSRASSTELRAARESYVWGQRRRADSPILGVFGFNENDSPGALLMRNVRRSLGQVRSGLTSRARAFSGSGRGQ